MIPAEGYAGDVTPSKPGSGCREGKAAGGCAQFGRNGMGRLRARRCRRAVEAMARHGHEPDFDAQLRAAVPAGQAVLLCRSGVRSIAAAKRLPNWGSPPTTFWKALRATRTTTASAGKRAAGVFAWPALAAGLIARFEAAPAGLGTLARQR